MNMSQIWIIHLWSHRQLYDRLIISWQLDQSELLRVDKVVVYEKWEDPSKIDESYHSADHFLTSVTSWPAAGHSITISRLKTISGSSLPLEVLTLLCGSESLLASLTGRSFSQRESSVLIGVPGLWRKVVSPNVTQFQSQIWFQLSRCILGEALQ